MKAACFYCKVETDVDSFSGLCVDCLILRSKEFRSMSKGTERPREREDVDVRKRAAKDTDDA